jgi:hypothetical protein
MTANGLNSLVRRVDRADARSETSWSRWAPRGSAADRRRRGEIRRPTIVAVSSAVPHQARLGAEQPSCLRRHGRERIAGALPRPASRHAAGRPARPRIAQLAARLGVRVRPRQLGETREALLRPGRHWFVAGRRDLDHAPDPALDADRRRDGRLKTELPHGRQRGPDFVAAIDPSRSIRLADDPTQAGLVEVPVQPKGLASSRPGQAPTTVT